MKRMTKYSIYVICLLLPVFIASCRPTGGSALIRGTLQHNLGSTVPCDEIALSINNGAIRAYSAGTFFYRTPPGDFTITAAYADTGRGISIRYDNQIALGDKELLDLMMYLRDSATQDAWALYRQGDYEGAAAEFETNLGGPSGNDALNGLGWTSWVGEHDYDKAMKYFLQATGNVHNVESYAAMAGLELTRVNDEGSAAFGRAYQDICIAIHEPNGLSTYPNHDDIQEGDLLALKALMSYVSGDEFEAQHILDNYAEELENKTNAHGRDILTVLADFMEQD